MSALVFAAGVAVAAVLIALLLATLAHRPLRIWPTPGPKSWQSYAFWPLFRGLNALALAQAALDIARPSPAPLWLRIVAGIGFVASAATFAYSFRALGRDSSYGAQGGDWGAAVASRLGYHVGHVDRRGPGYRLCVPSFVSERGRPNPGFARSGGRAGRW